MKALLRSGFLGCAIGAALTMLPGEAGARERRIDARTCTSGYDDIKTMRHWDFGVGTDAVLDDLSWKSLWCWLPDDSYLPKWEIVTINVHGADNSNEGADDGILDHGQVVAQACVTYFGSAGGACGDPASTGSTFMGGFNIHPSLSVWHSNRSDFAYLLVSLPPFDAGSSYLRGFFVRDF